MASLARRSEPGDRLLVCRAGAGWCAIHADDVNERFRELVGQDFTVKDLRTWSATVLGAVVLAGMPAPTSKRGTSRAITRMYREVSEHLGNTPAVAKKSYVDPKLVELFTRGTTIHGCSAARSPPADVGPASRRRVSAWREWVPVSNGRPRR